jgi:hypothetical protein
MPAESGAQVLDVADRFSERSNSQPLGRVLSDQLTPTHEADRYANDQLTCLRWHSPVKVNRSAPLSTADTVLDPERFDLDGACKQSPT